VRYAEIGTKSRGVQLEMLARLRDRVAERLAATDLDGDVTLLRGRVLVETSTPEAWERTLSARNATVTRTGDDGDGTATVIATFPPNRRLDLVVRRIRLEVRP